MRHPLKTVVFASLLAQGACGGANGGASTADGTSVSSSEVATSAVSGALNTSAGTSIAINEPRSRPSTLDRVLRDLNPLSTAYAASWTCSGDSLTPSFAGPGEYAFTPASCSVTWDNGKSASSEWSGTFALDYSSTCGAQHAAIGSQDAGCVVTRTTAAGGATRTLTGPDGNEYAILHDTNGAGTGWDASVSPAATNAGVIATCDTGGCSKGRTLAISGSHLEGTVTTAKKDQVKIWDHTVSTGSTALVIQGSGATRVVSGTVTVQHNLAKETAKVSFNNVGYGDEACCFPTAGSVSTAITAGAREGKTESLTFGSTCGDATLVDASGATSQITLKHCL